MPLKQAIIVRSDLRMGKGKVAAQCAHASLGAYLKSDRLQPGKTGKWFAEGQAKIVLKVSSKKELLELFESAKKRFPCELVHDAGRTQLSPGEVTCLGIGPAEEAELDGLTGKLKLL